MDRPAKRQTIILLLASCLLVFLTCLVWHNTHSGASPNNSETTSAHSTSTHTGGTKPKDRRPTMRNSTSRVNHQKPTHDYGQLKDFVLPELKLENVTFRQAIHQLQNEYYRVCQLTGERPILMKFDFQNKKSHEFSINLSNSPFSKALLILSSIADVNLII